MRLSQSSTWSREERCGHQISDSVLRVNSECTSVCLMNLGVNSVLRQPYLWEGPVPSTHTPLSPHPTSGKDQFSGFSAPTFPMKVMSLVRREPLSAPGFSLSEPDPVLAPIFPSSPSSYGKRVRCMVQGQDDDEEVPNGAGSLVTSGLPSSERRSWLGSF